MPIPALHSEELLRDERGLKLASQSSYRAAKISSRVISHFIDISVIAGFSIWTAKIFSIFMLAAHSNAISSTGKVAGSVFREAFSYSSGQLLAASFAVISVVYFIGLPLVWGRTPAQALMGLRIRGEDSAPLSAAKLGFRMAGCLLVWSTAGALCVIGFRKKDGRFFQDIVSGTRIVQD